MKRRITSVLGITLGASLIITSCDMRRELKDMHGSTTRMEKNTEKMVEITERMDKNASEMKSDVSAMKDETKKVNDTTQSLTEEIKSVNSGLAGTNEQLESLDGQMGSVADNISGLKVGFEEVYDGLRQGDSSHLRRTAFQGLIHATSHEKKLLEAAQYIAGFEYYFWRAYGNDALKERRNDLIFGAVQQFFKDVYELYNYNPEVFPYADPGINKYFNKEASFNALAAALHTENPKQKENIQLMKSKGQAVESLTFLSMIEDAVEAKINIADGKLKRTDVPTYTNEILVNYEVAIKLLQARWSFLAVAALDRSFHFMKEGSYRYVRSAWNLTKTWELDYSKHNSSQIHDIYVLVNDALTTHQFLKKMGVPTKPDLIFKAFVLRMRPTHMDKLSVEDKKKVTEILANLKTLIK